ncbi:hypothetical protein Goarm_000221 [Gossypium armourianum]|uniref:DUF4408 domain-containing protein n=1 Tax=Gossypium armourianum TaxID=34283 RepID=A0A7J9K995_9ROSI|nr:hypothetical protein [Gossypium armourianum]
MDAFHVKLEKRNATLKHRHQLRKVANVVRFVEFCVLLVLITRFTVHLPVAGDYFRGLSVVPVSPRFVFVIGNAIVIILFAKAGQFSSRDSGSVTDLYDEFVEKSEKNRAIRWYETENRGKQREKSVDENKTVSLNVHTSKVTTIKSYRRTQSENHKTMNCNKACKQLRKSGSEKYIKHNDWDEKRVVKSSSYPEDELSNEQFRNTVEAFIARQKKLLRDEEVLSDLERF